MDRVERVVMPGAMEEACPLPVKGQEAAQQEPWEVRHPTAVLDNKEATRDQSTEIFSFYP